MSNRIFQIKGHREIARINWVIQVCLTQSRNVRRVWFKAMSLWDTYSCINFCDPHWELICHNKWHPRTLDISTPLEIAVGTHFRAWLKIMEKLWLNDWPMLWVLICTLHLTECYYHVRYTFQSESKLCSYLNVKEHLARNRRDSWNVYGYSETCLWHYNNIKTRTITN